MSKLFQVNDNLFYAENDHVKKNTFINQEIVDKPLPKYDDIKGDLPDPFWEGHEDTIKCYNKAWEIAFSNLRKAKKEAGFVSDFIDTAFNGYLFMWDSSFIMMFGKYASRIFNFQQTLDNFYSHQHKDGFICREIHETFPGEQFSRDDPASTGPNILPWAEWDYFCSTGDKERLSKVFYPLLAYHEWLRLNRSWQDGSYWSCGVACGMDNQPRLEKKYHESFSHGFLSWIDACAQQYLSAKILIEASEILGYQDDVKELIEEAELLGKIINNKMWDEEDGFYYDTCRDGSFTKVKSIAAYWTLMTDLVSEERAERLISHLDNEKEFKRPNRIPSLSADHPDYQEYGGYWNGGVWAPTNYMVLLGLHKFGYNKLAYEIARDYVRNVTEVFNETGTLFENYSPEKSAPGIPSKPDFVGWTGLAPITILFEYIFGIHPDAMNKTIDWNINLTDKHGIKNYPLGDATVDLICEKRENENDEPVITIVSDKPITVNVYWNGNKKTIKS